MGWTDELHATLSRRAAPEAVAQIIRASGLSFPRALRLELNRVAAARPAWYVSSMSDDFERPADCAGQLRAAARMFGVSAEGIDPADYEQLRGFVTVLGRRVGGWEPGSDWKRDRLNKGARRSAPYAELEHGLASRRQYNRHVRVLVNLWAKAERMAAAQRRRELLLAGRSGFARRINVQRFAADPVAGCFVAYYTARKNLRREFTLSGRDNPVDRLAQGLLDLAVGRDSTDWVMVAQACPRPEVLARLAPAELGRLLGDWHQVMTAAAGELKAAWPGEGDVDRMTMVVRRGMDSSTWNTMAQAYNAARAAWIGCLAAGGALGLLEPACPGKVMRLMAADLAYWHRASGGDVDANTVVWARLPLPWLVLDGGMRCTAGDVRAACAEAGLDPEVSGWTAPRAVGAVAEFRPTPDLVHGIAVADPAWAGVLRRAGVFSGKKVRPGDGNLPVPEEIIGERPVFGPAGTYLGTTKAKTGEA